MTTGDVLVVYSLSFSLIKILPGPGFDLGSTAGESCVLAAYLPIQKKGNEFNDWDDESDEVMGRKQKIGIASICRLRRLLYIRWAVVCQITIRHETDQLVKEEALL